MASQNVDKHAELHQSDVLDGREQARVYESKFKPRGVGQWDQGGDLESFLLEEPALTREELKQQIESVVQASSEAMYYTEHDRENAVDSIFSLLGKPPLANVPQPGTRNLSSSIVNPVSHSKSTSPSSFAGVVLITVVALGVAKARRNTSIPSRTNSLQPPPQDNSYVWIGYKLNLNNYL